MFPFVFVVNWRISTVLFLIDYDELLFCLVKLTLQFFVANFFVIDAAIYGFFVLWIGILIFVFFVKC